MNQVHTTSHGITDATTHKFALLLACRLACFLELRQPDIPTESTSHEAANTTSATLIPINNIHCKYGYSAKQLMVLKVLIQYNNQIISFSNMADILSKSSPYSWSVANLKGIVERLEKAQLLTKYHARKGMLQGIKIHVLTPFPCKFLNAGFNTTSSAISESAPHNSTQEPFDATFQNFSDNLVNEIKKERSFSLVSDEEMKEIFPKLFEMGFQSLQINEIAQKRTKLGLDTSVLMKSLEYAEYELEHGIMLDKNNLPVERPENYVYASLLKNGAYRRPKGYCSPKEQLAKEEEAQAIRELEALKNTQEAKFMFWKTGLSGDQKNEILNTSSSRFTMPEDVVLRKYYTEHIEKKR